MGVAPDGLALVLVCVRWTRLGAGCWVGVGFVDRGRPGGGGWGGEGAPRPWLGAPYDPPGGEGGNGM